MRIRTAVHSPRDGTVLELTVAPRATVSTRPRAPLWWRLPCAHDYELLYRENLMVYQKHVGYARHFAYRKCGETAVREIDD